MVLESNICLVLHALGSVPLLEDNRVTGAVFESKEGRMAIRAAVTIDCTGDGDIFHRAGADLIGKCSSPMSRRCGRLV